MRHPLTNSLTGEEVEVTWKSSMFLPVFECALGTQPAPVQTSSEWEYVLVMC
ncbi:hypothetical protein CROQUDRAFT_101710 [Cronartium quercuum f. sp. fusiforme G11]|uniref:Uncharacterized protein n=1 Tax=Cronartium quercuum f. sp. fusiforme G11 TaxID=708437 RepID=A0A9P6N5Z2_9BASI|nr:hypothetical protein CROQUDRAFT_101710 [Cronartium quercuum f. sp. fusiforme G11]